MLCRCGQAMAEEDFVLHCLAPKGFPANGFTVHCQHCELKEEWTGGKRVEHLRIQLTENSTITCDCGANVWEQDGTMIYAWIGPSDKSNERGED